MTARAAIPHDRILSVEITGGFLKGLDLPLAASVVCAIGGRGSGKSTLFELIRFVVGTPTKSDKAKELLENLGAGRVRVHVETRHGARYVVERALGGERQALTEEGTLVEASPELFTIDAYSQNEIESVYKDRAEQLTLIDRFVEPEQRAWTAKLDLVQRALGEVEGEILRFEDEMATLEDQVVEARTIEEQLRPLLEGAGPDATLMSRAHGEKTRRDREKRALAAVEVTLGGVRRKLEALVQSSRSEVAAALAGGFAEGPNADVFAAVDAAVARAVDALEDAATRTTGAQETCEKVLGAQQAILSTRHVAQQAEYEGLLAKLDEEEGRASDRRRLQDRYAEVGTAATRLRSLRSTHGEKTAERMKLVERLWEIRDARYAIRDGAAKTITATLGGRVRTSVTQSANLTAYRSFLSMTLSDSFGGRPKNAVDKVAPNILPDDLADIVRRRDAPALVERTGLKLERANMIIDALSPTARLFALETVAVDDVARIDILHGSVWKDITEASPGQRASAILPILLLLTDRPLFIDQPEDNVDPEFLCNVILPQIERLKGSRQFFFVSHHANVPVLGDADRVVEIGSDGPTGRIESQGIVDEMRGPILRWLEGGIEAFERRRSRYER